MGIGDFVEKTTKKAEVMASRYEERAYGKTIERLFSPLDVVAGVKSSLRASYDNLYNDEKELVDTWSPEEKIKYYKELEETGSPEVKIKYHTDEKARPQKISKRIQDYLNEYYMWALRPGNFEWAKAEWEEKELKEEGLVEYFDVKHGKEAPFDSTTTNETLAFLLWEKKREPGISVKMQKFIERELSGFSKLEQLIGKLQQDEAIWVLENEKTSFAERTCNAVEIENEDHYKLQLERINAKLETVITTDLRAYLVAKKEVVIEANLTIQAKKTFGNDKVRVWESYLVSLCNEKEYEHEAGKSHAKEMIKASILDALANDANTKIDGYPETWVIDLESVCEAMRGSFDKIVACTGLAKDLLSKLEKNSAEKKEIERLQKLFHDACVPTFVKFISFADFEVREIDGFIATFKAIKKYNAEKVSRPVKKYFETVKEAVPEFYDEILAEVNKKNKEVKKSFRKSIINSVVITVLSVLSLLFLIFVIRLFSGPSDKEIKKEVSKQQVVKEKIREARKQMESGEEIVLPAKEQLKVKDKKISVSSFTLGERLAREIKIGKGNFVISVNPNTYNITYTFEVEALKNSPSVSGDLHIGSFVFKNFAMGSSDYEKDTEMGGVCKSFAEQLKSMKKGEAKTITLTIENPEVWNGLNPKLREKKERTDFVKKYTAIKDKTIEMKL